MKFGDFEINTFVEYKFKLDGGAMFGIIPRSMWQKLIEPDQNNLVEMNNNLFVLKANGKKILFDAGLGDTLSEREDKIYNTQGESMMDEGLASVGLDSSSIDVVVLSHLHTDHAGGAVKFVDNQYVPRFENAKYIVSIKEYESAMNPNERTGAVYVPERYQALKDFGQLELIDGNEELFPGVKAVFTGGHSEGHFALEMESGGQKVFYYADIFPSANHMAVPFVSATDLYPLQSMDVKRNKLEEIIDDNVIVCFDHDIDMPMAQIHRDGRKLVAEKVE